MRPAKPRASAPSAPEGSRYIVLNTGNVVRVDDADYAQLANYNWLELSGGGAYRTDGGKRRVSMHVILLKAPAGFEVDHINGDRFDNRRSNLRLAEHWQNVSNAKKRRTNQSGFKGVSRDWQTGRWRADLHANKKHIFLGRFKSVEEAAHAYDEAARIHQGAFARLNFPRDGERSAR